MNLFLLATHLGVFSVAWGVARWRDGGAHSPVLLGLGLLGVPIFAFTLLVMLDFSNHAGVGTHGAWYLIFSVVTFGALPAVTHASAAVSGVCARRVWRWCSGRSEASGVGPLAPAAGESGRCG